MDDLVRQAMAKWPHVPHCYGWLGLDARGQWYMRDDAAQAAGAFSSGCPGAKGSVLQHRQLLAFIGRNYAADAHGQWYFQNGPQRVYVELELTPWVWRVAADGGLSSHTGQPARYRQAWVDERGWLYVQSDSGFGVVHSQDMWCAAQALEAGIWSTRPVLRADMAALHGYVLSPLAAHKKADH